MGTLSENQTQKHNEEENGPGGEDLSAGAASRERPGAAPRAAPGPEGAWDLSGGSGTRPGLRARGRPA